MIVNLKKRMKAVTVTVIAKHQKLVKAVTAIATVIATAIAIEAEIRIGIEIEAEIGDQSVMRVIADRNGLDQDLAAEVGNLHIASRRLKICCIPFDLNK